MNRPDIVLTNTQRTCTITCKEEFTYKPYIPKKRTVLKKSTKAVFLQRSVPQFINGDVISFKALVLKPTAYCLYQMHKDSEVIEFTGQYGEQYTIELSKFEMELNYSYATISGEMTVLCVQTEIQDPCENN